MSAEQEIRESVDEAKAPGTFNILNILKNRGYPKSTVSIILNEELAYEASVLQSRIDELDKSKSPKDVSERKSLIEKIENIRTELGKSAFTVHLEGVSEGKREELYQEAKKKYPVQYEENTSLQSMVSGNGRVEKESPERDALFTDFLWQAHIRKIVDPDGNEQTEFPYSTIREMRNSFPVSAIVKINDAIEKLRTATAVFIMETGEDFLAKP